MGFNSAFKGLNTSLLALQ